MTTENTKTSAAALIDRLSPRQLEILALLAKGLTNDDIGGTLHISVTTVRTHVTAVLSKLEVTNRTEAAAAYAAWGTSLSRIEELLKRPAIAVLPFLALDAGDRERAFALGISYDLAALFARWCWFPVISNATSGLARANDTSQSVGLQLGARFLVSGTLRCAASSFRLTVRIDDANNGCCLWTERYDLPPGALFEVQDTICNSIVAAVYPMLVLKVQLSLRQAHPSDLEGWELAHDGLRLQAARGRETNETAQLRFRAALGRAPDLVLAYYGLGLTSFDGILNQWVRPEEGCDQLLGCATRCIALAPHAAEGYYLLGRYHETRGDYESAALALKTAVAQNPSFATAHALLAQVLQITGHSDEALARIQHSIRLSPRSFVAGLATLHFIRGEYEQALDAAEKTVALAPHYPFAHVLAVASAWWLGERGRAREHLRVLRATHPSFAHAGFLRTFGAQVDPVRRIARALEQLSDAC